MLKAIGGMLLTILLIILIAVVCTTLIVTAFLAIVPPLDRQMCMNKAEAMELEWRWGFWTGCLIRIEDRWIPLDQYEVIEHKALE